MEKKQKNGNSGKPIIFISHLHEEGRVARALKDLLLKHFGDAVTIFVSSDDVSIRAGENWQNSLLKNLQDCVAEIILCSPSAMQRHWIHFEAGAGWVREILVMPVCYAGMTKRGLVNPLAALQSIDASEEHDVAKLVYDAGKAAGITVGRVDCEAFLQLITEENRRSAKERKYTKYYKSSADVQSDLPGLIESCKNSIMMTGIHFNISLVNRYTEYLKALESGVTLTICAVNPKSPIVKKLAVYSGADGGFLRDECKFTISNFNKLKNDYLIRKQNKLPMLGRLNLRLSEEQPHSRIYLFDSETSEGHLIYVPYLKLRDSTQCPTFRFSVDDPPFQAFKDSVSHHIEGSQVFFDSTR